MVRFQCVQILLSEPKQVLPERHRAGELTRLAIDKLQNGLPDPDSRRDDILYHHVGKPAVVQDHVATEHTFEGTAHEVDGRLAAAQTGDQLIFVAGARLKDLVFVTVYPQPHIPAFVCRRFIQQPRMMKEPLECRGAAGFLCPADDEGDVRVGQRSAALDQGLQGVGAGRVMVCAFHRLHVHCFLRRRQLPWIDGLLPGAHRLPILYAVRAGIAQLVEQRTRNA